MILEVSSLALKADIELVVSVDVAIGIQTKEWCYRATEIE